ncbi:hypothetical protein HZH68_005093 [Vespula germanica]|uniref:Uncharacterized protein n=1 Tax=Vespula germanica TaxID=30212 RepID=A0A834NF35_VESGE|nr:hypothetical protein HZH68_005093 [Vespula germanica]
MAIGKQKEILSVSMGNCIRASTDQPVNSGHCSLHEDNLMQARINAYPFLPRFKPEERQSTLLGGVRTDLIPPSGCKCCRSVEYTLQSESQFAYCFSTGTCRDLHNEVSSRTILNSKYFIDQMIYLEGGNSLRTMYFPLIILPAELGVSNEVAEIALMMPPWLFLN